MEKREKIFVRLFVRKQAVTWKRGRGDQIKSKKPLNIRESILISLASSRYNKEKTWLVFPGPQHLIPWTYVPLRRIIPGHMVGNHECQFIKKEKMGLGTVVHIINLNTWVVKAERSLRSRQA